MRAEANRRVVRPILWAALAFFCLSLGLWGCGKEKLLDPTIFNPGFKGITFTDSRDNFIGPTIDADDWHWDSYWPYERLIGPYPNPPEYSSSDTLEVPLPTDFFIAAAYPNPTEDSVTISYGLPIDSWVFMAIIDDELNIVAVFVYGTQPAGYRQIRWDLRGYWGDRVYGGVYRCIFKVEARHKGERRCFRSHGDIWVK